MCGREHRRRATRERFELPQASASSTIGLSSRSSRIRTSSIVPSVRPSPGPIATASALSAAARIAVGRPRQQPSRTVLRQRMLDDLEQPAPRAPEAQTPAPRRPRSRRRHGRRRAPRASGRRSVRASRRRSAPSPRCTWSSRHLFRGTSSSAGGREPARAHARAGEGRSARRAPSRHGRSRERRRTDLRGAERHGHRRAHGRTGDLTGRGVHPGRNVNGDHGTSGRVDQLDHPCGVLTRCVTEARCPAARRRSHRARRGRRRRRRRHFTAGLLARTRAQTLRRLRSSRCRRPPSLDPGSDRARCRPPRRRRVPSARRATPNARPRPRRVSSAVRSGSSLIPAHRPAKPTLRSWAAPSSHAAMLRPRPRRPPRARASASSRARCARAPTFSAQAAVRPVRCTPGLRPTADLDLLPGEVDARADGLADRLLRGEAPA